MDPHKRSATIEIIDGREQVLAQGRYGTDSDGYRAMLAVGRMYPQRVWAVEGCNGIGRHVAQRLVADGEVVVDVPAKLSARARVFATGQGRKTDPVDAHSVAVVALRTNGLRQVMVDDATVALAEHEQRAKCRSLEGFGRALHGAQDFYSHSNWADEADPARPIGADNPPGLNLPAPSPVLDLRGSGAPTVPPDLTTGCYVLRDSVPGVGVCERRVSHAGLNKDLGLVDQNTGSTASPTTPRGKVGSNFAKAVAGAIVETRHQWQEFRAALEANYGAEEASLMVCALTRDDPSNDCGSQSRTAALVIGGVLCGVLAVGLLVFGVYRRRRAGRPVRSPP